MLYPKTCIPWIDQKSPWALTFTFRTVWDKAANIPSRILFPRKYKLTNKNNYLSGPSAKKENEINNLDRRSKN